LLVQYRAKQLFGLFVAAAMGERLGEVHAGEQSSQGFVTWYALLRLVDGSKFDLVPPPANEARFGPTGRTQLAAAYGYDITQDPSWH
jgi:hypothetical protein